MASDDTLDAVYEHYDGNFGRGQTPFLVKLHQMLGDDAPTPEETVRAALDDAAFDAVRLALATVKEGPLAAYSFVKEDAVVVPAEEEFISRVE